MQSSSLPRTIWMYWQQGESSCPPLVKNCVDSWRYLNPEWEVKVLDKTTARSLVDLQDYEFRDDIGIQMYSDIIRIKLLSEFGGVWADASLFCSQPLDDWLPNYLADDFFAFASHRNDRLMTNWFLAARKNSETMAAWGSEVVNYWKTNIFDRQGYLNRQIGRKLMSLRKRGFFPNNFWFSNFVVNFLKVSPYPVNMYLFERAFESNPQLAKEWRARPHLYDTPAEKLQNELGMNDFSNEESRRFIDGGNTPVHKLNWRQDLGYVKPNSNLEYLIESTRAH